MEAMLAGMIYGQCMNHEDLGNGFVAFNRRYMYGALSWCTENYADICDKIRELMGSGIFLMPAKPRFSAIPSSAGYSTTIGRRRIARRSIG